MPSNHTIVHDPETSVTRSAGPRGRRRRSQEEASSHTARELQATVCHYFCRHGLRAPQIRDLLEKDHRIRISREEVYRLIRVAAARGWIQFTAPPEDDLRRRLSDRYGWLQAVSVVETGVSQDVSEDGAAVLLALLKQRYAGREVHLGFSGGTALRTLAHRFAELLREPDPHLPRKIVFHAMVAGFDVHDPTTDPNAFFTYFAGDTVLAVETEFVALHVTPVADENLRSQIRAQKGVEEVYGRRGEIDVVVTSATSWKDRHSVLRHYLDDPDGSAEELERAGCIGDMLWQPIGRNGTIALETPIRANTLMDLAEVGALVERGRQVLLVAGPCTKCHTPKSDVVKAILEQPSRLVTHVVVDARCARAVLAER